MPKERNHLDSDSTPYNANAKGHYDFTSVVIPSAWIEECNHDLKWDNDKMMNESPPASASLYAVVVMIYIMLFNSRLHQAMLIEG